METEEEQHITTLLCMGFPDPDVIRKALRLAKNDINEAVALLTNESPGLGYGYEPMESGPSSGLGSSGDGESSGRTGTTGFDPPPAYHDVVDTERSNDENGNCSGGSMEFPTTNLYELESRVFTDHWSIPYKREESLGKCLIASTCLARHGLADADENCKRFVDRCMPEAFKKLLTSSAVHKWGTEIHEGIYNMLMLLVELVAERVKQDPVPVNLMGVLTMALNPDNEYHFKNRMKPCQRNWAEVFGDEANIFAVSPSNSYQKVGPSTLYLLGICFELGGFAAIQTKLNSEDIEIACVSALVQPLGVCAEYLNSSLVQPMLDPVIHKTITYVQNLEEKDLKDKRLVSIPDLLSAIKLLCMRFQRELVAVVDDLRLDTLLRMLKTPHFSTKMNSLKEVTKLIEESTVSKSVKNAIDTDKLLDWLVENSVLSIALEGNIDQAQYCERIKGIIELLGSKLSLDELSKIWRIQAGQSSTVIENIHTIIAAAAVKFSFDQLTHLFVLIQKSWEVESDRVRQKLLSLIGRIGREARSETTTGKVLEVLWELAHLPTLPTSLVQQALEEHLGILSDAYAVKETVKRNYIIKCIEDIKKTHIQEDSKGSNTQSSFHIGTWVKKKSNTLAKASQQSVPQAVWVVPALRQLHEITRSFIKQTYQKQDKSIIQDLKKNFEIVKLMTGSLVCCHRLAVTASGRNGLSASTLVDGRYTYQEYLDSHLRFLAFFLQEASLYLVWSRAKELWECLVTGPDVCELDREMCFEWFTKGQHDLESDVQQQLFKEKILKLEPYEITMNGFSLFKTFFENVNLCDHRLKRQGTQLCVERLDLQGMDFIWRIAMETPDEEIANEAIQLIITYSYTNLNPKMKKDSVSLHKKFIADCYKRLEAASSALGGPTLTHAVTKATKMLTATAMPTVATSVQSPSRSTKLVIIERLLLLAERYVITIEDLYSFPRTILPHGASFNGHPVALHVTYESTKDTFTLETHSNETVGSIRWKIAEHLSCPVDNVQIFANDSVLTMNRDQKLLSQLGFSDEQSLTVKSSGTGTPSGSSESSASASSSSSSAVFNSAYALEQEKALPGVVMALVCNVFEMLYQLANLDEPRITLRVRKLLLLIPTDPEVQDALDNFVPKESSVWSHQKTLFTLGQGAGSRSPSVTPKQQHQPSAASILESLFRSSAPGMSTFRVLYNLEVLSSKLMPTSDDEMAKTSSKSFCENFLKAGGLSLVVNVMQRDSIPSEVDYETRQGVYSICLQLARFLLVGQSMPAVLDDDIIRDGDALSSRPFRNASRTGRQLSLCGTPEKSSCRQMSLSERSSIRVEEIIPAARVAIQTMEVNDFTSTVACFMRLTWAAAAGRLDLVGSPQPIKETHSSLLPQGVRTRVSSTASFYTLLSVNDFIIDILLGSPSSEIRHVACDQLYTLSQSDTSAFPEVQKPNLFLLSVILTAQLPLWSPTSVMRGVNQRLLSQCTEYFDLRCQLLDDLTTSEMEALKVSAATMLEDEISWLDNFEPSWSSEMETSEADNILLAGHLRLIKTLLSLCGNEKEHLGPSVIQQLLDDFLFRASRIIINSSNPTPSPAPSHDFHPKCSTASSRLAAYEVLVMLADSSLSNLRLITKELLSMHHQSDPSLSKEFDVRLCCIPICRLVFVKHPKPNLAVPVSVVSIYPPWRAVRSQDLSD
uniref:ubiquitinyl hydrolase 1 n=1 Tax=Nothobranchius furzeri TaxID=105023 RepID=A0A8C6PJE4_NOTFU